MSLFYNVIVQDVLRHFAFGVDGLKFNAMMQLHAEQYLKLNRPFPTQGIFVAHTRHVELM